MRRFFLPHHKILAELNTIKASHPAVPSPAVCWTAREKEVTKPMINNSSPTSTQIKLAVFDLDGTLKAARSPYDFVHRALGVKAHAARVFARYQRGELSYFEWGQEEIGLWRDLPVERLMAIIRTIPYWPGAVSFVQRLKAAGVVVALVSAGFDLHVEHCAAELDADVALCNRLGVANGRLTGEFIDGVDSHNKGQLVQALQVRFGATRAETLAAGDTPADIRMFPNAAVSVAVAPAELPVAEAADLLFPDGDWSRAWEMIEAFRPGWLIC
jgi:phosphoserine phosphatase